MTLLIPLLLRLTSLFERGTSEAVTEEPEEKTEESVEC